MNLFPSQRRPRLAFGILCAGVAASVVVTFILALTRHSLPTQSSAQHTPAPSATATTTASPATPSPSLLLGPAIPWRIAAQVSLGRVAVNATFVSQGAVWVATTTLGTHGQPGSLLRIDASSGRRTANWPIGGDAVAVAAAGGYVWVANSYGDGSLVLPDENTVMQFNATTGMLAHVYRVAGPTALVADGSGALAVSSPTNDGPTDIYLLGAGRSSLVTTVPGNLQGPLGSAPSALAVCGSEVYLGVTQQGPLSINVYSVSLGGGPARDLGTIHSEWSPVVTCDSSALYVFDEEGDPPVRVDLADGRMSTLPGMSTQSEGARFTAGAGYTAAGPTAVAFESGLIWEFHIILAAAEPGAYLSALNPNTGQVSSSILPVPTPGQTNIGADTLLLHVTAPRSPGLWVVVG